MGTVNKCTHFFEKNILPTTCRKKSTPVQNGLKSGENPQFRKRNGERNDTNQHYFKLPKKNYRKKIM